MDDKAWIKNHQGVLYQRIKKNERDQGIKNNTTDLTQIKIYFYQIQTLYILYDFVKQTRK